MPLGFIHPVPDDGEVEHSNLDYCVYLMTLQGTVKLGGENVA